MPLRPGLVARGWVRKWEVPASRLGYGLCSKRKKCAWEVGST